MTKARRVIALAVCGSMAVFAVQTLSQPDSPNRVKPPDFKRLMNLSEQEKQKEMERWRKEKELAEEQRRKNSKKEQAERIRQFKTYSEQRKKDIAKETADKFWREQLALGVTGREWNVIREKLEKVDVLRSQARMPVIGVWSDQRLPGAKGPNYPSPEYVHEWTWEWHRPSKEKGYAGLTEDERATEELIDAVENRNAPEATFERVTRTLRDSRSNLQEQKKQKQNELSDARQELKKVLTTRQEAVLVLMGWL